jgi:hypothetical protein
MNEVEIIVTYIIMFKHYLLAIATILSEIPVIASSVKQTH